LTAITSGAGVGGDLIRSSFRPPRQICKPSKWARRIALVLMAGM
jgi:hypothetical protein